VSFSRLIIRMEVLKIIPSLPSKMERYICVSCLLLLAYVHMQIPSILLHISHPTCHRDFLFKTRRGNNISVVNWLGRLEI